MKRIVLLISFLAALALCASAQTYIDFHDMPMAVTPSPMPDLYPSGVNLYWDSFFYVTPGTWDGAGPGFWVGPNPHDVVFVGGPMCTLAVPCSGSIKLNPLQLLPPVRFFTPVSITLSAGWLPNHVTITAFNNGTYVGAVTWALTTTPHTYQFPASWRHVSQLVFTPEFIPSHAVYSQAGSTVIYSFILMMP